MDPRAGCDEGASLLALRRVQLAKAVQQQGNPAKGGGDKQKGGKKKHQKGGKQKQAPPKKPKAYEMKQVAESPRRRREPLDGIRLPEPDGENVLITSALPYVNNVPHLGNIIGCVLSADVYARWCRQRGKNVVYICGTDEYGTATESKALAEGLTPRAICDRYHAIHRDIYKWFDISFDHFGRTSHPDPKNSAGKWPQTDIAQEIFRDNMSNGNLVEKETSQVYCADCKRFLADRFVEGTCPKCGYDDARGDQCDQCGNLLNATDLLEPRCKVDAAHNVGVRTSDHLFLDLARLQPAVEEWFARSSVEGAWSINGVRITDGWLKRGLEARAITRDLKWGTPVPHERYADKVFYVWFDAPIGYVSITATYTPEWRQWWQNPSNVKLYQFMGKDNVPFHSVIFPSSLLGTAKPWTLVNHISTTEYLNYESGKFSKSRNVGVFGDSAQETGVPSEVWRYVLLANRPETNDSVFTWDDFQSRTNNELLKNLGNFVNRALAFSFNAFDKQVPAPTPVAGAAPAGPAEGPVDLDPAQFGGAREAQLVASVNALLTKYNELMGQVKIRQSLATVLEISAEGNLYLQETAPWKLRKEGKLDECASVVAFAVSLVRLVAAVAEPFMPGFTDKVAHVLGLPHADIPDAFRLTVPPGQALQKPQPLFSPIQDTQVEEWRARFSGGSAESAAAAAATAGGAAPAAAGGGAAGLA